MKLITAIIQENKLDQVREALIEEEVYRITVTRVSGRGQQVSDCVYRGQTTTPNLVPKVRIDIAVNEEWVERTINAILRSARYNGGSVGDGKIFVTPLNECIRIRTGERGCEAI
ncbi:MAG: P-II family nitrogen regulator [Phycisphaerales bacterium]|nr:P-II family nitrogen regulator [Phycisphaerales bacterium]